MKNKDWIKGGTRSIREKSVYHVVKQVVPDLEANVVMDGLTYDMRSLKLRLIIEVDSSYHDDPDRKIMDSVKNGFVKEYGYTMARINPKIDGDDFDNIDAIAKSLRPDLLGHVKFGTLDEVALMALLYINHKYGIDI